MAILGIDEVGRGPLAGPLVVGAVILPERKSGFAVEDEKSCAELSGRETTLEQNATNWICSPAESDMLCEKLSDQNTTNWILELRDSKKLTPKKREKYAEIILKEAPATALGWVTAAEIDEIGIAAALRLAVRRAIEEVQKTQTPFSEIIIDGKVNFLEGTKLSPFVTTLVKADDLIKEVSAASIIAKVARDRYMTELSTRFPAYLFEKNMGYGTAAHLKALREKGPCPEHRRSFEPLKSQLGNGYWKRDGSGQTLTKMQKCDIIDSKNVCYPSRNSKSSKSDKNTTLIGARGEVAVSRYLEEKGHTIIAQNYKTKTCEIDIISISDGHIYFTEVKYRKNDLNGSGFEAITKSKLKQMEYAAKVFMSTHQNYQQYSPILAAAAVAGPDFQVEDWVKIVF